MAVLAWMPIANAMSEVNAHASVTPARSDQNAGFNAHATMRMRPAACAKNDSPHCERGDDGDRDHEQPRFGGKQRSVFAAWSGAWCGSACPIHIRFLSTEGHSFAVED